MHPLGGTAGPNASVSPAPAAGERDCSDTLLDDAVKRQGFQGEPQEAFGTGLHVPGGFGEHPVATTEPSWQGRGGSTSLHGGNRCGKGAAMRF